jgi:thiamine biosynthesis lipoprotein ApbE
MADGYATALLVLGPERGREIAAKLKLNVLWVE